jgi:two-component system chemotaxis response regulator CheY
VTDHMHPQDGEAPGGPTVLVVDDAPTVRLYHGALLREAGFTVHEAGNGLEAYELALQRDYDLYLVDINMPQMDGLTLVGKLRSAGADVSSPVVVISTEAEQADVAAAHAAGANHHLVKPVDPEVLRSIAEALTAPLPAAWSLP